MRRIKTAAAGLILFLVNVYVCRELFAREYINQMGSIESAFISIARYAAANFGDLSWFPLWYNGIPYQNSYPPLLHLIVAAVSRLSGASAALSYHFVTAFLYCIGAVSVYALCLRLSGRWGASFFAGLMYSVLSPSASLISDVRQDLGSIWRARRLQTLLTYGEGPHVAGLALLPLAILLLDIAIHKRRPQWSVLAALAFAGTVLTNWLAAAALGAAVLAYLLANYPADALRRTAMISALAYCFAAPWIPPSTIRTIQFNAKTIGGDFTRVYQTLPVYGPLIVAGLVLLVWLLRRLNAAPMVRFAAVFSFLMAVITLPASYWNIYILPQPHRYHLEMELGLVMLIPFLLLPLTVRIPPRPRVALAALLIACAVLPAKQYRRYARILMAPVDMSQRMEYRMARWFDQNMHGARVLATGSVSFWMNAFTDTPQLGGGFDQGTTNFMNRVAIYLLYTDEAVTGDKADLSMLWLKAFGVDAVGLGGADSGEYYKPWHNPRKFAGRYEVLWHDGGDYVYKVPRRSSSLAHVMAAADLAPRTPVNGIDVEPLRPYVAALDDPANPLLDFRWTSRHSAVITGTVPAGRIVSVQVTWDKGWHVSRGTLRKDELGLIALDPQCSGSCSMTLTYDGGLEMKVARLLCWIALGASILWSILWRLRSGAANSLSH